MNYGDWYTDRMDIFRAAPVKDGALSKHQRVQVAEDVPCRIYRPQANGPRMQSTAAAAGGEDKLDLTVFGTVLVEMPEEAFYLDFDANL